MLLDLDDPSKVIAQPSRFILAAEEVYECVGQVPNVVFTGGAVEMADGTLNVYYGGADTRICLAQTTVDRMVDFCLRHRRKGWVSC
jgi:beta-1,4-mannooligosaccharide/beta-1,4-mannosyl-N-acetylglucosamine phosphorylase